MWLLVGGRSCQGMDIRLTKHIHIYMGACRAPLVVITRLESSRCRLVRAFLAASESGRPRPCST